jgi:hypothetical protein
MHPCLQATPRGEDPQWFGLALQDQHGPVVVAEGDLLEDAVGGTVEAGLDGLRRRLLQPRDAFVEVVVARLHDAVGVEHQRLPGQQGAAAHLQLGPRHDAQGGPVGPVDLPAALLVGPDERRRVPRAGQLVLAGVQVDHHVYRGREGVVGVLPEQEVVGRREQALWR